MTSWPGLEALRVGDVPRKTEALQRVDERADRLSMYATLLDDPGMINRQLARYLAVGAAEIQAVAAEVLRADNRAVLTYMPAAQATGPW